MDEKDHCARGLFNARITTVFIFTAVITGDRMVKLLENRQNSHTLYIIVVASNVLSTWRIQDV
jgi:hypothetical protein